MRKNLFLFASFSFALLSAAITANGAVIDENGSGTNIHLTSNKISSLAATATTKVVDEVWVKNVFKKGSTELFNGTKTNYNDYQAVIDSPDFIYDSSATYRSDASHTAKTSTGTYLYSSYCQLSGGTYTGKCAP
ncbi:hypothetical protein NLX71_26090 [Paenibacillus sp. MZ04-78.2]|uniref:hypothetical protein n=1 Tax=Paenibacillus sp. MZ04-78.2 TaxID=2962034 RepID=UPI0020B7B93D|nr:hypothetical protein [Paenibacillus sp. MZ04-78.2]MCP3776712.1 hypothetical protein [Paenibacillus sp. MZ04-78.2]